MKVSVIIPTYRRPALLGRSLDALAAQTLARDRYEVLVVDDGSPEPCEDVVTPFHSRIDVRYLRKENGGLASTRNYGASHAGGDLLLFMDDDILPCPEFLEAHVAGHLDDDRAVALGSLPHPADLPLTPFLYYLNRIVHYDLFLRFGAADSIPLPPLNGNSSVRREHFERVGGYDLAFGSYGGEDTEMGYRLLRAGLHFVYAPRARGYHYHLKDFAAYKRDMYSSGVTMVTLVRKHPEVLERVNMDLVVGHGGSVSKQLRRAVFHSLRRLPLLVRAMDLKIRLLEPLDLRRLTYPLYLLVGHYHYGLGMFDALERGGLGRD